MTAGAGAGSEAIAAPWGPTIQLEFLRRFAAYDAVADGVVTWLSWRDAGGAPRLLGLRVESEGEVRVDGSAERARHILQADVDLGPLEALVGGLPPEAPQRRLHARFRGTRPVQFGDAFEGLCWTVLAQQVSVSAAASIKRRLTAALGDAAASGSAGVAVPVFPAPARLLAAGADGLRRFGVSRQKAATLLRLAAEAEAGDDLQRLARAPTAEAYACLTAIAGVGPWSARYALGRVYGHRDALPSQDVGLRRAWGREAALSRTATADEVEAAAAALPGWGAYLAWYLWLSNADARAPLSPAAKP